MKEILICDLKKMNFVMMQKKKIKNLSTNITSGVLHKYFPEIIAWMRFQFFPVSVG